MWFLLLWIFLILLMFFLVVFYLCFFFNDTATTEIYTLSHTTLFRSASPSTSWTRSTRWSWRCAAWPRSEEHTSELQSRSDLVCRLLLEKKKNQTTAVRLGKEKRGTTDTAAKDAEV